MCDPDHPKGTCCAGAAGPFITEISECPESAQIEAVECVEEDVCCTLPEGEVFVTTLMDCYQSGGWSMLPDLCL